MYTIFDNIRYDEALEHFYRMPETRDIVIRYVMYAQRDNHELWMYISEQWSLTLEDCNLWRNYLYWIRISMIRHDLSEDIFSKFWKYLNWKYICRWNREFSPKFLLDNQYVMDMNDYMRKNFVSNYTIRKMNVKKIPFNVIETHQYLDIITLSTLDFSWTLVSQFQILLEYDIIILRKKLNWVFLQKYQKLSEDFLYVFADRISWPLICRYQKLSEKFMNRNARKLFWPAVSAYQSLSLNFLQKYQNEIDWSCYIRFNRYDTNDIIQQFPKRLNWNILCFKRYISCDTLNKYSELLNWNIVSRTQILDEWFMRKFADKLNWKILCKYQVFSPTFIYEMQNRLNWPVAAKYQDFTNCHTWMDHVQREIVERSSKSIVDRRKILPLTSCCFNHEDAYQREFENSGIYCCDSRLNRRRFKEYLKNHKDLSRYVRIAQNHNDSDMTLEQLINYNKRERIMRMRIINKKIIIQK